MGYALGPGEAELSNEKNRPLSFPNVLQTTQDPDSQSSSTGFMFDKGEIPSFLGQLTGIHNKYSNKLVDLSILYNDIVLSY